VPTTLFSTILFCDRQIDRQTDRQTEREMAGYAVVAALCTIIAKNHFNFTMSVKCSYNSNLPGSVTAAAAHNTTATAAFQFIYCGCNIRYNHHYNSILVCPGLWMPYTVVATSDTIPATTAFNST
jgi:hypothetical protein